MNPNPIEQAIEARALQLAEGRLEYEQGTYEWSIAADIMLRECAAALTALREAVKQEPPYAYIYEWDGPFGLHQSTRSARYNGMAPNRSVPVFTTPQAPETESSGDLHIAYMAGFVAAAQRAYARAVEAEVIRRGGGQS